MENHNHIINNRKKQSRQTTWIKHILVTYLGPYLHHTDLSWDQNFSMRVATTAYKFKVILGTGANNMSDVISDLIRRQGSK
jgi:hypothetical protein